MENLLITAINAALKAGAEISKIFNEEWVVSMKNDGSPLTNADETSHAIISEELMKTGLPVLSEEGAACSYNERCLWNMFWLVDPLDGTKEFISKNGEFTVNIALVENCYPVLGVIYVPIKKILYFGGDKQAYVCKNIVKNEQTLQKIISDSKKLPLSDTSGEYTVVASRSHLNKETEDYIKTIEQEKKQKLNIVTAGSSLKICLVAEGKANLYPRLAPTMEWDTAAGQAIAEAAGRTIVSCKTGEKLRYNKKNLINDWFVVK